MVPSCNLVFQMHFFLSVELVGNGALDDSAGQLVAGAGPHPCISVSSEQRYGYVATAA